MKINIKTTVAALVLALVLPLHAQAQGAGRAAKPNKKIKWTSMAPKLGDGFFATSEAARIGDNLLFYQHPSGGWPKNLQLHDELTDGMRKRIDGMKLKKRYATIDNKATTTEITYLARLYNATGQKKYLDAVVRGFGYMFEAQYGNGGWPQFYPLSEGYYTHITYNDDAMVNVLKLMRDAMKGKDPFGCLPDSVKAAAAVSLDKGVDCILKTQVVQDGRPTVWCAQYDENTLKPAKARAYELVSLSGQESDDIVLFLMSLSKPSPEVRRCVEDAVAWFRKTMIKGMRMEKFTNTDGKSDVHLVPCPQGDTPCQPLWARFYTIDGNRPFFCDRDGVMRFDLSEIGYERRNGYRWYNSDGMKVLKRYESWARKYGLDAAK
ncbi:pectate lyase [Prevotella sp. CAG:1058]|nr:pectate lyase [Prevotella sp. CAG:1058]